MWNNNSSVTNRIKDVVLTEGQLGAAVFFLTLLSIIIVAVLGVPAHGG